MGSSSGKQSGALSQGRKRSKSTMSRPDIAVVAEHPRADHSQGDSTEEDAFGFGNQKLILPAYAGTGTGSGGVGNTRFRKQSDQTMYGAQKVNKPEEQAVIKVTSKKGAKSDASNSRFSGGSGASTQVSSSTNVVAASSSTTSPDTQTSPSETLEEGSNSGRTGVSKEISARDVMMSRFNQQYAFHLPGCDREDLELSKTGVTSDQAAPEFAQEVYIKLLQQEVPVLTNYLFKSDSHNLITEIDRDNAALNVLRLCKEKGYRRETHLLGVNILDRYLALSHKGMLPQDLPLLVCTSTILAAKLEQPMTPSIRRMIKLLSPEEQLNIEKEDVIELEQRMLIVLSFDFNLPNSLPFLERFLRLAELHTDPQIVDTAHLLLLVAASRSVFLDFRPSRIAACAIIIASALSTLDQQIHVSPRAQSQSVLEGLFRAFVNRYLTLWSDNLTDQTGICSEELGQILPLYIGEVFACDPMLQESICQNSTAQLSQMFSSKVRV